VAHALCRKYSIELDPGTTVPGGSNDPDDGSSAPDKELDDAGRRPRMPRNLPALIIGVNAACHLKNDRAAQCADEGN